MRYMVMLSMRSDVGRAAAGADRGDGRRDGRGVRQRPDDRRRRADAATDSTTFTLRAGALSRVDGPFAEAKEVVGGYAVLDVRSHEEAVEGARRMMQVHLDHWPGWEGSAEVRRISEPEEGPPTHEP